MGSSAAHAAASRRIGGDVNTDLSQTSHTSRIAAAKDQIKQQQTQLQAQMQQLTEHKQRLELEAAASQKRHLESALSRRK